MPQRVWTHRQFDEMSWHDNHVHALRIVAGSHGAGRLILDIDYILDWVKGDGGSCRFRIVPATLEFIDVTNLRFALDYATPTAGLAPFSIHAIERRMEHRERYEAQIWTIQINWPVGEISFEAAGFEQRGFGEPILTAAQFLNPEARGK
jgi:hypothetical protein